MSIDIGELDVPAAPSETRGGGPSDRGLSGPPTGHPSRQAAAWVAALVVILVVIGTGGRAVIYRQTYQPLSSPSDNNATGATLINSAHGQTGQWYDPYAPHKTTYLAVTLSNDGNHAVTIDRVYFSFSNIVQGPVTYDSPQWMEQVGPSAQRRPLDHTTIDARGALTVVVPLRYVCNPAQHVNSFSVLGDMSVVYDFWGEHHTVELPTVQPVVTSGGEACPAALRYLLKHGHYEGD